MNENIWRPLQPSIAENTEKEPEKTPDTEQIDAVLSEAERINTELEREIATRFGEGFYDTIRARMDAAAKSLLKKGDDTMDWVQIRGLPLPKSKAGIRVLSGVIGVAGATIPGLGVLLPLSYVLWKRGEQITDHHTG